MSLADSTIGGVRWTAAAGVVQRVVQFGLSILLMRLLGPSAFGLIAMVVVFTGFAAVLSDLGFASAIIQKNEPTPEYQATAFWTAVASGAFFFGCFLAAAPFVAAFFQAPVLEPVTRVVAVTFVASSIGAVPRALLQKQMRFNALAAVDTGAMVLSGIVAVFLALLGAGVWALVLQRVLHEVVRSGWLLVLARWRPRMAFSAESFAGLLRFGGGLTGFNVVNYWSRNADNLIIGRIFGSADLGLYTRAYSLMILPLSQIMQAIMPVLFPALSSIQEDSERIRRIYLRVIRATTFLTFPVSLGLVAVAEPFVRAVLGPEWLGVIPLLQILTVAGAISSATSPIGSVFLSQGRTQQFFYLGLASGGTNLVGILAGVLAGDVIYVAWGVLCAHVLGILIVHAVTGRLFGIGLRQLVSAVGMNGVYGLAMLGVVLLTRRVLGSALPPGVILPILVALGAASYLAMAKASGSQGLADVIRLFRHRRLTMPPEAQTASMSRADQDTGSPGT